MISSFINNNQSADDPKKADLLCDCLTRGNFGAALLLAKSLEKTQNSAVLFNIGLVYSITGENTRALEFIDNAIAALRKTISGKSAIPRPLNFSNVRAKDTVLVLKPISANYADEFPDLVREDVMMAGAHIANAGNLPEKKATYLSGLVGPEFNEFKKGII